METQMTAVPEGRSDADALLAQDDAEFVATFLKGSPADASAQAAPQTAPDPVVPAVPATPGRDPATGKFTPVPETPAIETIGTPTDDDLAPEAEAEVPPEAVDDARFISDPITPFKVFDAEGELDIPNIEIELKGNGKVQKVRLDKVVRLAQMGSYNEELQGEVADVRQRLPAIESERDTYKARFEQQAALNRAMLADEATYLAYQDKWNAANTPEAQLDAARREIDRLRNGGQQSAVDADVATQGIAFIGTLTPVMDGLLRAHPTITMEEAYGKFVLLTQGLQERGVIPPARYQEVMNLVEGDLGPWMAQLHDARATRTTQRDTASDTAIRRAQEEATKAKRTLARRFKPTGQAPAGPIGGPSPTKQPETADQAVDQIMAGVAAGVRGR